MQSVLLAVTNRKYFRLETGEAVLIQHNGFHKVLTVSCSYFHLSVQKAVLQ